MKHIKHWLATMAVLLCSIMASAHDFEVGGIYYNITSSTDLTVAVTYRGSSFNSYYDEYEGAVTIPSTVTYNSKTYSVTSIGDYAFHNCSCLETITLPKSVTSIGERAFYGCSNLTTVTLPESVTSIGERAFVACASLTSITLPKSMTSIRNYVFSGCTSLTSIILPESVTSIGYAAFNGCNSLTSITLPESVTSIGDYAFDMCERLYKVINYSNLPLSAGSNSYGYVAYHAEKVYQGGGLATVDDFQFYTSNGIHYLVDYTGSDTEIVFPNNYNGESYRIGDYAFYRCSNLEVITLSESVTSIGDYAFYVCSSLTSITLSKGVTSIGFYAFCDCSNLIDVHCYAEKVPKTDTYAFNNTYAFNSSNIGNATLHVLANALNAYKNTAPWSSFGKFEILPPTSESITLNQYGSGTYCSPYALDFSEVEGLKAYAATGYDSETGVVTLTRVMTAKAGMGLFVKGEPGDYVVPVLENTSFNTLNMLVGTLEDVIVNGTDGLYTNYKYAAPDGEPLFYQFADGSTQKAGRAYLQIPTSWLTTTAAKSISYRFDDGETTDIENSEITTPNSEFIYDLYGRRVENPVKGGVYIVKGKKIVY